MGIQIYAFADEADTMVDGQIRAMTRNRLAGVEMRGVNGANVAELSDAAVKEYAKKLRDAGLSVWAIGSPVGKTDIDGGKLTGERERLKRMFEIADLTGAENIRIFSFFLPKNKPPEDYRSAVLDELGIYAEMAEKAGVTLCHENEKGIYGDTAERCLDILRSVPAIRGVFDPANFVQCGEDTWRAWELLAPYIRYMHVKDALKNGTVVPAGHGVGNLRRIAKAYAARGGEVFTVEPHLTGFIGLSGLERAGEASIIGGAEFHVNDQNEAFDLAVNEFRKIEEELK